MFDIWNALTETARESLASDILAGLPESFGDET